MPQDQLSEKAVDTVPVVPPSSAEVGIRTMQSDLELIGKSGGMPMQQFTRVEVPPDNSPAIGPAGVPPPPAAEEPARSGGLLRAAVWVLVIFSAAAILLLLGYYISPLLFK